MDEEYRGAKRKRGADDDDYEGTGLQPSFQPSPRQLVLEEIDLEIALRQQLAAALDSRIVWARLLQESLRRGPQNDPDQGTSDLFRHQAIDALEAIQDPCNMLFSLQNTIDPSIAATVTELRPSSVQEPITHNNVNIPAKRHRRRRSGDIVAPKRIQALYVRDSISIAKLSCPDCRRSDFPSLQGLFNHCRFAHKREWGSHDECIQNCVNEGSAVASEEDKAWVEENGLEVGRGMNLPSLRRLFEQAVGVDAGIGIPPVSGEDNLFTRPTGGPKEEVKEEVLEDAPLTEPQPSVEPSVYLTRTLGLHKDSPALAPFLGRAPKRRCINAGGEDEDVDILGDVPVSVTAPSSDQLGHNWRMHYRHRNVARPELDQALELTEVPSAEEVGEQERANEIRPPASGSRTIVNSDTSRSRFHISARVILADYSARLKRGRRPSAKAPIENDVTHRWMISVTSPSYSLPVTTFLSRLTVACLTDPSPSETLKAPVTLLEPPYAVVGTTSRSFLARITMNWAGSQNPPLEVEHWVELDPFESSAPVLGDEQVRDVDLDRNTELLPVRENVPEAAWKSFGSNTMAVGDSGHESRQEPAAAATTPANIGPAPSLPGYVKVLKALVSRFPMTGQDTRCRAHPRLSYKLVSTSAQLLNLTPGHRKAIEWGRARSLRDAYMKSFGGQALADDIVPLTTGDVYHWLEDEGFFPRPHQSSPLQSALQPTETLHADGVRAKNEEASQYLIDADVFCPACGLRYRDHRSSDIKAEPYQGGESCPLAHEHLARRPLLDVTRLLAKPIDAGRSLQGRLPRSLLFPAPMADRAPLDVAARDLVAIADPKLTLGVHKIISILRLPSFLGTIGSDRSLLVHKSKEEIEPELAPYSLLATLTGIFLRHLIRSGLTTITNQERAVSTAPLQRNHDTRSAFYRLLTPSHILQGLHDGLNASSSKVSGSIALALGRIGVTVEEESDEASRRALHSRV